MVSEKEFISQTAESFKKKKIKSFPTQFISFTETKVLSVPPNVLVMGEEFFGMHEILTAERTVACQASTYTEAKYIVYAGREMNSEIAIPTDEKALQDAVTLYEKYLDDLMKEIVSLYKKQFPEGKNSLFVMNEVIMQLRLVRY